MLRHTSKKQVGVIVGSKCVGLAQIALSWRKSVQVGSSVWSFLDVGGSLGVSWSRCAVKCLSLGVDCCKVCKVG